ncbi:hypothetical protein ACFO25_03135 [Paenactinomyces guangxiensis]|uniref:Uncharacterized protein n=1 Tax=Paenactinomyces guangxiensis TaxID=1490290 RepID=A0A7W1WTF6_9BACL|nr:hypothetical protein [Paenactinomyces guangxiensis]MBA4495674.1 hypothetical protein [Paenactinomyces guangxiensis]MBH8592662.1 hypothetical protein [Paenactinomyces guangxiensis]
MLVNNSLFHLYTEKISSLPEHISKKNLLRPDFLLEKENGMEISYGPFDYLNPEAKIVKVGITPGWSQMMLSYAQARDSLRQGNSAEEICYQAKKQASLAGPIRVNMIRMMDEIGISQKLGLVSSQQY